MPPDPTRAVLFLSWSQINSAEKKKTLKNVKISCLFSENIPEYAPHLKHFQSADLHLFPGLNV